MLTNVIKKLNVIIKYMNCNDTYILLLEFINNRNSEMFNKILNYVNHRIFNTNNIPLLLLLLQEQEETPMEYINYVINDCKIKNAYFDCMFIKYNCESAYDIIVEKSLTNEEYNKLLTDIKPIDNDLFDLINYGIYDTGYYKQFNKLDINFNILSRENNTLLQCLLLKMDNNNMSQIYLLKYLLSLKIDLNNRNNLGKNIINIVNERNLCYYVKKLLTENGLDFKT